MEPWGRITSNCGGQTAPEQLHNDTGSGEALGAAETLLKNVLFARANCADFNGTFWDKIRTRKHVVLFGFFETLKVQTFYIKKRIRFDQICQGVSVTNIYKHIHI